MRGIGRYGGRPSRRSRQLRFTLIGLSALLISLANVSPASASGTYTVTLASGSGAGSLPAAFASGDSEIQFALSPGTEITLPSSTISVAASSSIDLSPPGGSGIRITGSASPLITLTQGTLSVENLTFTGATGGVFQTTGTSTLMLSGDSFFSDDNPAAGGALHTDGSSSVTATNDTFDYDDGGNGGAIAHDSSGTLAVSGSTFYDDIASGEGGAIYGVGPATVSLSTITDNSANSAGGALANTGSGAIWQLNGDTIDANTVTAGSSYQLVGAENMELKDTIIAGSASGPGNCDVAVHSSVVSLQYPGASCGSGGLIQADPDLSPAVTAPSTNGTEVQPLGEGSPAIDVVPPADCVTQSTYPNGDQVGFPRPAAGQADCDIGAFEDDEQLVQAPSATDITSDGATVTADFSGPNNSVLLEPVDSCAVDYGTTSQFGQSVPCTTVNSTDGVTTLTGLTPDTQYIVREDITTPWGTVDGPASTFTTPPGAPTAGAPTVSGITQTSASLGATANPEGGSVTDCHFSYGTTAALGSTVPCTTPPSGTAPTAVSAGVTGLLPATTYSFQFVLTTSEGTAETTVMSFSTDATPTTPTTPTTPAPGPVVPVAVPTGVAAPTASGSPSPGATLSCSTGTWTGAPTGYSYQWFLNGDPIPGATASTYTLAGTDEGSELACEVIARNAAGPSAPAQSNILPVPIVPTKGCPASTGTIHGTTLGPVRLGLTRGAAAKRFPHSHTRGKRYETFFCLTPIGIRVVYGSPRLLAPLARHSRARYANRVVLASTSNKTYTTDGIRVGGTLASATRDAAHGDTFVIGLNTWYVAEHGSITIVLKTRHGIVQEVGIALPALTRTRAQRLLLLKSIY